MRIIQVKDKKFEANIDSVVFLTEEHERFAYDGSIFGIVVVVSGERDQRES